MLKEDQEMINQRLIGKTMWVVAQDGWYGEIVSVVDTESVMMKRSGFKDPIQVDIFDLRNPS